MDDLLSTATALQIGRGMFIKESVCNGQIIFKGYKRFFLDVGHLMRIILLCEATETNKRSRIDSHQLIGRYVHCIVMLYKTHR